MPTENELLASLVGQLNSTGKVVDSASITHVDRMKVAICGEPKTGKSNVVARTARKPLLVYDFDDRAESIAEHKDVMIKTLVDTTDTNPVAWGAFESDLGTLLYAKEQNKQPFKSIMLDSITFLRKYAEHQFLKDSNATKSKYKIGVVDYLIPKDWDAVTGVQKMLEGALSKLFSLGIDVYATFHTRNEKDQLRSTKENAVYKDTLTVDPPNLKMLLPKFNDQWRTYVEDGKYMVQLKPDYQFNAATVLKNVNDTDIQELKNV
jgi:hypothetical protein